MDKLARSIATRTDMPLRQLGWHMPWLSQIMSPEAVEATLRRISDIARKPTLVPCDDESFVTGMLVESVLPALEASQQLDLLQSLPSHASYYFSYMALTKGMSGAVSEARLHKVMSADAKVLERTLLFLSTATLDVTDELRKNVAVCLSSADTDVVAAAAEFARYRADPGLDDAVMALDLPTREDQSWRANAVRNAIATAIGRRGRGDLIENVPLEHLDWVAAKVPEAQDKLAATIDTIIMELSQPLTVDAPRDAIVVLEVKDDPTDTRINLLDRAAKKPRNLRTIFKEHNEEMSDTTGSKYANRQQLLNDQVDRFLASLQSDGALAFAQRPYSVGLSDLAAARSVRYEGWLLTILGTTDQKALLQLQNLGLTLAQNYAKIDSELAASVLTHLWKVNSYVTVEVGDAKHSLRHLALFGAASSPEIDELRLDAFRSALDDREIEQLTLAAVAIGADEWLDRFIDDRLSSKTAADNALAITICSFRPSNAHSTEVLGRDWGRGFLAGAAGEGRVRYERASHAAYWFEKAAEASDRHERWQYLELGFAAADRRQLLPPSPKQNPKFRLIGGDIPRRLDKAAAKASTNAAQKLLGQRRPTNLIEEVILG